MVGTFFAVIFQLWLALASLCVLRKDHVDSLSSGHWVSDPDSAHGNPKVRTWIKLMNVHV